MKKLLVTLGLAAVAAGAFAQGTVNPANTASTQFRTNSTALPGGTTGNTAPALNGFYYEVLTAPSTVTTVDSSLQGLLSGPWSDTSLLATNTGFATGGRMGGPSGSAGVVQNWPQSANQSYIVVGWSANEGTTWAQVAARLSGAILSGGLWSAQPPGPGNLLAGGWVGASAIKQATAGLANGTGTASLFGGTGITTTTDLFVVGVIPEPSTFALIGLGSAAMLIFRRRK